MTIDTNLVVLRGEVAKAQKVIGSAVRNYARGLNEVFGFAWYNIEAQDQSEQGKIVKTEKGEFYKPMKEAGHSNPSTVWARVRAEGKADAIARGLFGEVASEAVEGEGEGNATHARSPLLRNIEELTALWKFNGKQTGLDPKVAKAQQKISEALIELGVNLNMINK